MSLATNTEFDCIQFRESDDSFEQTLLSQDLEQSKAEMLSAQEMQLQVGQERAAGAEREAEYKARIASLDAQLRAAQHQRSARCLSVGHDCSLQLTCRDAGVRAEGAWGARGSDSE